MLYFICFICFLVGLVVSAAFFGLKKNCSEEYNKGINEMMVDDETKRGIYNTVAKKVVKEVIEDKLNALKEDYEIEKGIFHLPIRLEIMKLENIKDEICVALDDEFLPPQRA